MVRFSDEHGETLLELMITILVIAIGLVAIVAVMGSSIVLSDVHRNQAEGEVVVRSFAEAVIGKASKPVADAAFKPCPNASDLTPTDYVPPAGQANWNPSITHVWWWIRNADPLVLPNGSFKDEAGGGLAACQAQCPTATCQPGLDSGLMRVEITVTNPGRTGSKAATTVIGRVIVRRGNPT